VIVSDERKKEKLRPLDSAGGSRSFDELDSIGTEALDRESARQEMRRQLAPENPTKSHQPAPKKYEGHAVHDYEDMDRTLGERQRQTSPIRALGRAAKEGFVNGVAAPGQLMARALGASEQTLQDMSAEHLFENLSEDGVYEHRQQRLQERDQNPNATELGALGGEVAAGAATSGAGAIALTPSSRRAVMANLQGLGKWDLSTREGRAAQRGAVVLGGPYKTSKEKALAKVRAAREGTGERLPLTRQEKARHFALTPERGRKLGALQARRDATLAGDNRGPVWSPQARTGVKNEHARGYYDEARRQRLEAQRAARLKVTEANIAAIKNPKATQESLSGITETEVERLHMMGVIKDDDVARWRKATSPSEPTPNRSGSLRERSTKHTLGDLRGRPLNERHQEHLADAERYWSENPEYAARADEAAEFLGGSPELPAVREISDNSSGMNRFLRDRASGRKTGKEPAFEQRAERASRALNSAIESGHTYDGTMYRGVDLPTTALEEWTERGYVRNESFLSTSAAPSVSEGAVSTYSGGDTTPVVMRLRGKSGVPVSGVSKYPHEQEVMVPPGRNWRIVRRSKDPSGRVVLDLEEVDTLPQGARAAITGVALGGVGYGLTDGETSR
jgi:hypothetical protein